MNPATRRGPDLRAQRRRRLPPAGRAWASRTSRPSASSWAASTANVSVAAARLGRTAAIITGVGDDPFGRFVRRELVRLGVADTHVVTSTGVPDAGDVLRDLPARRLPALLLPATRRRPTCRSGRRTSTRTRSATAGVFWVTVTGLSEEPSREAHHAALAARGGRTHTVLDLDYRPMFWDSAEHAPGRDPEGARPGHRRGGQPRGVRGRGRRDRPRARGRRPARRRRRSWPSSSRGRAACSPRPGPSGSCRRAIPITPLNGLGAGDSFGGSLAHGLLAGRPLEELLLNANAAGAIVASRLECSTAMPTQDEIDRPASQEAPPMTGFARSTAELTEIRARHPQRVTELLASRRRRALVPDDGRLMLVACDHPARGALSVRGRSDAMHDRADLLDRLQTALARPGVDGLLATADIVEDLLLLGALEDKVVITSMNRGGLSGSSFEMDDRMTAYDVQATIDGGFNGGKMLARIDLDDAGTVVDPGGVRPGGHRARPGRAGGDARAVHVHPQGRAGGQRPHAGRGDQVDPHRPGTRRQQRAHVAQAAGGRGDGARDDRDDAAHPAARRRPLAATPTRPTPSGPRRSPSRRSAASSSDARCSTRPTTTWRRRSTPRSPWCGHERAGPDDRGARAPRGHSRHRRLRARGDARDRRAGSTPACACWPWLRAPRTPSRPVPRSCSSYRSPARPWSGATTRSSTLQGRTDVFSGPTDFAYLPIGSTVDGPLRGRRALRVDRCPHRPATAVPPLARRRRPRGGARRRAGRPGWCATSAPWAPSRPGP